MRFVYLGESRTGNIGQASFAVTLGGIVHVDSQWKALEQSLRDWVDSFVRPEDRPGFFFNAIDLYHGTKNESHPYQ